VQAMLPEGFPFYQFFIATYYLNAFRILFTHSACSPPPSIANGVVSYLGYTEYSRTIITAASVANYTCKPNFALVGSYLVDCTDEGSWTPVLPTCKG